MADKEDLSASESTTTEFIKLSLASYGDTPEDIRAHRRHLIELAESQTHSGYDILDANDSSNYFLTGEDLIENNPGCFGCCVEKAPTIEELSFAILSKQSGRKMMRIRTIDAPTLAYEGEDMDNRVVVHIEMNGEIKGVVKLDFPPSSDGTIANFNLELVPTAVFGNDGGLSFIFRQSTETNCSDITEIITADGAAFVVAKIGPAESLVEDSGDAKDDVNLPRKDQFCLIFLDGLLSHTWKQLLLGVASIYFYLWLIHKAYKKKYLQQEYEGYEEKPYCKKVCNCAIT